MLITHDPDERPELTPELLERARRLGASPVNIICDEPGAKVGDPGGVTFLSLAWFIPRVGDRIELEGGKICEVKQILFAVSKVVGAEGEAEAILLMPNIVAHLIGQLPSRPKSD